MNERIKELYKQAAQFGQDDYNNRRRNRGPVYEEDELTNIVNQKFAELIVKECGNIAFEHWALTHDTSSQEVILKYFGIE
jgi:hypothetical protein